MLFLFFERDEPEEFLPPLIVYMNHRRQAGRHPNIDNQIWRDRPEVEMAFRASRQIVNLIAMKAIR